MELPTSQLKRFSFIVAVGLSAIINISFCTTFAAAVGSEWKVPARKAQAVNPVAADETSIAAGDAIYRKECVTCHGATGKGDGPGAKENKTQPIDFADTRITTQSDGELFWKITVGRKPMPGFKKLLSDTQRWQLVNYMRVMVNREDKGQGS